MKCDTLSALKLWVVRKKGCKKTGNRMTKSSTEIIQDDFRPMACHTTMFPAIKMQTCTELMSVTSVAEATSLC